MLHFLGKVFSQAHLGPQTYCEHSHHGFHILEEFEESQAYSIYEGLQEKHKGVGSLLGRAALHNFHLSSATYRVALSDSDKPQEFSIYPLQIL